MLENIVQYASTNLRHLLMAKYDNNRMEYFQNAEELAQLSQAIKTDVHGAKATGRNVVVHVGAAQPRAETRTCYNCNKVGHILVDCCGKKNEV